jgi:hypothetical protein
MCKKGKPHKVLTAEIRQKEGFFKILYSCTISELTTPQETQTISTFNLTIPQL